MNRINPLFLAASLGALALSGCKHFEKGVPQDVAVLSYPREAKVEINGERAGETPLQVALPRKSVHRVRLEKEGYNPAEKYFAPIRNEAGMAFVQFGLMEDLGYYYDLDPAPMKAKLESRLVPTSVGADPFQTMARKTLQADRLLEQGEITPLEHRYIVEQIIEFFEKRS